jgi:hypothetical protein
MQKLYRMSEAAEILGVTVKTLQRWDKLGKVHFIRTPNGNMIARRGYYFKTEKPKYDTVLSFPKKFNKYQSNFSNWRTITNHVKKQYLFQDKIEILKADS